jgi:archaellum component FlaC
MMQINELEKQLKSLNNDITVVSNDTNEMAGIYWKNIYTGIALPKEGVYPTKREDYCDTFGKAHRSVEDITKRVEQFLSEIERPEYLELLSEDDA